MTSPTDLKIRALLPEDAQVIRALHQDTFEAHVAREEGFKDQKMFIGPYLSGEPTKRKGLIGLFGSAKRLVLVAERSSHVAGYIAGVRRRRWIGGSYADIADLTVAPEARGQGVGRALLSAFEASAKEFGACRIIATIWARNTASERLFERGGFKILRPTNAPLLIARKRIGGN